MLKQYLYRRSTTATKLAEPPNIFFRTFLCWVLQMCSIMENIPQEASVILNYEGEDYSVGASHGNLPHVGNTGDQVTLMQIGTQVTAR
jgi:hypothetical protein